MDISERSVSQLVNYQFDYTHKRCETESNSSSSKAVNISTTTRLQIQTKTRTCSTSIIPLHPLYSLHPKPMAAAAQCRFSTAANTLHCSNGCNAKCTMCSLSAAQHTFYTPYSLPTPPLSSLPINALAAQSTSILS